MTDRRFRRLQRATQADPQNRAAVLRDYIAKARRMMSNSKWRKGDHRDKAHKEIDKVIKQAWDDLWAFASKREAFDFVRGGVRGFRIGSEPRGKLTFRVDGELSREADRLPVATIRTSLQDTEKNHFILDRKELRNLRNTKDDYKRYQREARQKLHEAVLKSLTGERVNDVMVFINRKRRGVAMQSVLHNVTAPFIKEGQALAKSLGISTALGTGTLREAETWLGWLKTLPPEAWSIGESYERTPLYLLS